MVSDLTVCNVKGRFKVLVDNEELFRHQIRANACKLASNFAFVSVDGLKYSIFDNSRSVNVTGLESFARLTLAAQAFCQHYNVGLEDGSVQADNSTIVGYLTGVDRGLLAEISSRPRDNSADVFLVIARTRWFPSVHLRVNPRAIRCDPKDTRSVIPSQRRLATCTLFPSGKLVILGAKTLQDARFTARRAVGFIFQHRVCRCWTSLYYDDPGQFVCNEHCKSNTGTVCTVGCSCEFVFRGDTADDAGLDDAVQAERGVLATLCAGYLASQHGVPAEESNHDGLADLCKILYADTEDDDMCRKLDIALRYVRAYRRV